MFNLFSLTTSSDGYKYLGNLNSNATPSNIEEWKTLYLSKNSSELSQLSPIEVERIIDQLKKLPTDGIINQDITDIGEYIRKISVNEENGKVIRKKMKNTNNPVQRYWQSCAQRKIS